MSPIEMPHEIGRLMDYASCVALTQSALRIYWRRSGDTLHKMHKLKPYPDSARVVAEDGSVICRWTIDEELGCRPMAAAS